MHARLAATILAVLLLPTFAFAHAHTADKKTLTLAGARKVLAAAAAEAQKLKAPGAAIAVVDDAGHLIALERLDNTFPAGANISIGKARTAAIFRKPTSAFEQIIKSGRTPMIALADFTPLQGGVPITIDGQTIGAVGVSGAASAQQDEDIALAAASALSSADSARSAASPVTYFDKQTVAAAFAKGATLVDGIGRNFMVHASRRETAGQAEVHTDETDIIYVLAGSADFVTGGTMTDPRKTADGEIRGTTIQGGQPHTLSPGDIIIVPPNTPHWFRSVSAPFTYYVVKVR